jgi:hypothetical protein
VEFETLFEGSAIFEDVFKGSVQGVYELNGGCRLDMEKRSVHMKRTYESQSRLVGPPRMLA